MGRLAVFFLAWFIPLTLIYADPRMLGVRWSQPAGLPFTMVDDLQLASSWRLIKHSALRLVCASSGQLHLLLQARTPGPREYVSFGDTSIGIFVDGDLNELEIEAKMVAVGQVDTIVTAALTAQQLILLSELFGSSEPWRVSAATGFESMVFMSGDADGTDIRQLATRCVQRS